MEPLRYHRIDQPTQYNVLAGWFSGIQAIKLVWQCVFEDWSGKSSFLLVLIWYCFEWMWHRISEKCYSICLWDDSIGFNTKLIVNRFFHRIKLGLIHYDFLKWYCRISVWIYFLFAIYWQLFSFWIIDWLINGYILLFSPVIKFIKS